jgi:HNH endonuclease
LPTPVARLSFETLAFQFSTVLLTKLYDPVALKLYAFGLMRLHDPNWTGLTFYEHIRERVKGQSEPNQLLRKPIEKGLLYCLGVWLFDDYFYDEPECITDPEYQIWFLEDALNLVAFHLPQEKSGVIHKKSTQLIERANERFGDGENAYIEYLNELNETNAILGAYDKLRKKFHKFFSEITDLYASNYADRVFHDRQLCQYISHLLPQIGFDGTGKSDGGAKWINRQAWPARIKRMLNARERGMCANCNANMSHELSGEPQIDHIVPLARGGSNDLVNLQQLCQRCNNEKRASLFPVLSSIPEYIKRAAQN